MRSAYHKFKMRRSSAHSEASGQAEEAEPAKDASASVAMEALSLRDGSLEPAVVEGGNSAVASPPAMLSPLSSTASVAVPLESTEMLPPAVVNNVRSGSVPIATEHIEHIEQPEINVALRAPSASDATADERLIESAASDARADERLIESAVVADVAAPTKPLGGTSVLPAAAGDTAVDHSWSAIHADNFMVRHGPNYKKVGKKPSESALYEMAGCDLYSTATSKMDLLADKLKLPTPPHASPMPHVPALLVVNVQLPLEEPSMLRSQSDGATLHCVFYFTMSAETAQQLSSAAASGSGTSSSELSPSLQLLCEYCSRAESDAEMRGRFKTMATVNNIEA
eukprot:10334-Heterococcus_DN1.PRE.1